MRDACCRDDNQQVTAGWDNALDYAITCNPNSRQEFGWHVASYLVGWLNQARIIPDACVSRYWLLTDHYGQISLGKGVINDVRGH